MAISIAGTGSYLPQRVLTNRDLEKMVNTTDEWIVTRTGIRERHIAAAGEAASDMGAEAARRALAAAGIQPGEVEMIIVATATPDMPFPNTACLVQAAIGARNAFCFDIEAACSGFLYALEVGRRFVETGAAANALIIGAEKFSAITDWQDRDTCVLFGDGAGAVVISRATAGRGIIGTVLASDGTYADLLKVPCGGSRCPPTAESIANRLQFIRMDGREVFRHAVRLMCDAGQKVLDKCGMTIGQIDRIVPHQANARIVQAVASRLEVPMEKFYLNLDRAGNVSAASVPIALDEAVHKGVVRRGDVVLFLVLGAGFTWGAMVVEY